MATFGSLFAGIGGIDLGLERAGWECRWQVEWDAYCQRVLAKHWPDVPRYGDITTVDWSGVERVDLLAGGFPCQPVSGAGKRQAQADERWLWPEFARAVRALRPRLVLVENVTNLLAINGGSAFGEVVGDLAALGYDVQWDCVPAAAVGALHERDRVWIVAYADGDGRDVASSRQGGSEGEAFSPALAPRKHRGDRPSRALRRAGPTLADTNGTGSQGRSVQPERPGERAAWANGLGNSDRASPDAHTAGRGPRGATSQPGWWSTEPDVRRMADGLPEGLDEAVDASQGLGADDGSQSSHEGRLRDVWEHVAAAGSPSFGRRSDEQLVRELADRLCQLPHGSPLEDRQDTVASALAYVHGLRQAGEAIGTLRDASNPLAEAWLALPRQEADWWDLATRRGPWAAEWPGAARVATGVPNRVDRLRPSETRSSRRSSK